MRLKLDIHPDSQKNQSQYVRLFLEQYLVDQGVNSDWIIWRTLNLLSFKLPDNNQRSPEEWVTLINERFEMDLCSVHEPVNSLG